MTSASAMRRSRKNWTEAEEACLISGVEKVFLAQELSLQFISFL
jgi:hypothetical protein